MLSFRISSVALIFLNISLVVIFQGWLVPGLEVLQGDYLYELVVRGMFQLFCQLGCVSILIGAGWSSAGLIAGSFGGAFLGITLQSGICYSQAGFS